MDLKQYWNKRDFDNTPEPRGHKNIQDNNIYVIQKHQATQLHYDLRLEMDGVLKSWAIPKEPPITPGIKRLAVQVEDHPLDYAYFEGTIPKGEYGAGIVEIWDKGFYILKNKKEKKLVFELQGYKLIGDYCLLKFKEKNWLFFKKKT